MLGCTKLFRFYLIGAAEVGEKAATTSQTPLAEKTAVFLSASGAVDGARPLEHALAGRLGGGVTTETTMFVNRDGEQTYSQKQSNLGAPLTLVADGGIDGGAFAKAGMEWLGLRLEKQKLESLGSLMPWHEFK